MRAETNDCGWISEGKGRRRFEMRKEKSVEDGGQTKRDARRWMGVWVNMCGEVKLRFDGMRRKKRVGEDDQTKRDRRRWMRLRVSEGEWVNGTDDDG